MSPQIEAIAMLNAKFNSLNGVPIDSCRISRSEYAQLVQALASLDEAVWPSAYGVRNSDGILHSLTTTKGLAERTARQLDQELVPLFTRSSAPVKP